jgi:hypothetical protein
VGGVAVLPVECNNGGGTADGQIAFALVVFTERSSTPSVLGVLSPREPASDGADHVPVIGDATIDPGKIIVDEGWYGRNDGTCCPTGKAITTWTLEGGSLVPSTVVSKEPSPFVPNPATVVHSGTYEGTFVGVDAKSKVAEFFVTCQRKHDKSKNVYDWIKVDLHGATFLGRSSSGHPRQMSFGSWSSAALAHPSTVAIVLGKGRTVLSTFESVCHGTLG